MRIEICVNCGGKCKPQNPDDEAMCRICRLKRKRVKRTPVKKIQDDISLANGIQKQMRKLSKTAIDKENSALLNIISDYKEGDCRKDLFPKMRNAATNLVRDWFKFYDENRFKTKEVEMAFRMLNEDEIERIKQNG